MYIYTSHTITESTNTSGNIQVIKQTISMFDTHMSIQATKSVQQTYPLVALSKASVKDKDLSADMLQTSHSESELSSSSDEIQITSLSAHMLQTKNPLCATYV
mgnify:CR=1 FL=1